MTRDEAVRFYVQVTSVVGETLDTESAFAFGAQCVEAAEAFGVERGELRRAALELTTPQGSGLN